MTDQAELKKTFNFVFSKIPFIQLKSFCQSYCKYILCIAAFFLNLKVQNREANPILIH